MSTAYDVGFQVVFPGPDAVVMMHKFLKSCPTFADYWGDSVTVIDNSILLDCCDTSLRDSGSTDALFAFVDFMTTAPILGARLVKVTGKSLDTYVKTWGDGDVLTLDAINNQINFSV